MRRAAAACTATATATGTGSQQPEHRSIIDLPEGTRSRGVQPQISLRRFPHARSPHVPAALLGGSGSDNTIADAIGCKSTQVGLELLSPMYAQLECADAEASCSPGRAYELAHSDVFCSPGAERISRRVAIDARISPICVCAY